MKIRESFIKLSKNYNANLVIGIIAVIIGVGVIIRDIFFDFNPIIKAILISLLIIFYYLLDWMETIRVEPDNVLEKNKLIFIILSNFRSVTRLLIIPTSLIMLGSFYVLRSFFETTLVLEIFLTIILAYFMCKIAKIISKKFSKRLEI